MTKEELKQEAEESFEQYKVTDEDYVVSPYSDDMGEKMLMYNDEYYAEETYLRLYKQGYLAGAEPREKRIAELEKRCANYEMNISKMEKGTCDVCKETEKDKKIAELETRCNELFLQTCGQVEKIKELKSEIENDRDLPAIAYMQGAEKQKKKDEDELKKWKEEWQEQVQKANDEGYARTLQTIQLTKAKELLKEFVHHYKAKTIYVENMQDLLKQSEQFISEVEK